MNHEVPELTEPTGPLDSTEPHRSSPLAPVPPPGVHGGDGARVAAALGLRVDEVLDLSASLNPVAPPAADVVARHLGALTRYPDPHAATEALAEVLDVEPSRVILTNGGAEAIALVGAELGGVVAEPDFSLYPRTGSGPRWRSNPHSPSGVLHLIPTDRAPGAPGTVWDEAFWPLATGTWTRRDFDRGDVVVGSLTKLFACPGLRVGYVIVPDGTGPIDGTALHRAVAARQPHWSVGGLVCAALPELLATADLVGWRDEVDHLRGDLEDLLTAHGLQAEAGDGPWVLVGAPTGLRDRLALQGVVVRDCSTFGRPDVVRIAVPTTDGLARLDQALHVALDHRRAPGTAPPTVSAPSPATCCRAEPRGSAPTPHQTPRHLPRTNVTTEKDPG